MHNFESGNFSINKGSIHYTLRYIGEPVFVFLYGGFGQIDMTTWNPLIENLPESISILLYDRPGIGKSRPLPPPRTANEMASELKLLLDHLKIEKIMLIGHSMGGLYARYFASRFPEYLTGLLLLDATNENQLKMTSHLMDKNEIDKGIESAQKNPERMRIPQDPDRSMEQISIYPDIPDSFIAFVVAAGNSLPNSIPGAEEINRINIDLQKKLAHTSNNAEFILASGSSHFIYLDQPELVVNLINRFVRS